MPKQEKKGKALTEIVTVAQSIVVAQPEVIEPEVMPEAPFRMTIQGVEVTTKTAPTLEIELGDQGDKFTQQDVDEFKSLVQSLNNDQRALAGAIKAGKKASIHMGETFQRIRNRRLYLLDCNGRYQTMGEWVFERYGYKDPRAKLIEAAWRDDKILAPAMRDAVRLIASDAKESGASKEQQKAIADAPETPPNELIYRYIREETKIIRELFEGNADNNFKSKLPATVVDDDTGEDVAVDADMVEYAIRDASTLAWKMAVEAAIKEGHPGKIGADFVRGFAAKATRQILHDQFGLALAPKVPKARGGKAGTPGSGKADDKKEAAAPAKAPDVPEALWERYKRLIKGAYEQSLLIDKEAGKDIGGYFAEQDTDDHNRTLVNFANVGLEANTLHDSVKHYWKPRVVVDATVKAQTVPADPKLEGFKPLAPASK